MAFIKSKLGRKILLFFILLGAPMYAQEPDISSCQKALKEVVDAFVKQMKEELGLTYIDHRSNPFSPVEEIVVHLMAHNNKIASLNDATILEVQATERLLWLLNSSDTLRSHLCRKTFSLDQVQVFIEFEKKVDHQLPYQDRAVARVFQTQEKIVYQGKNFITGNFVFIADSSYEVALKQVRDHFAKYGKYIDEVVKALAKQIERDFGLICSGDGASAPDCIRSLKVIFISHKQITIEQARELEVKATERLLHLINTNERMRPFLYIFPFPVPRAHISLSFQNRSGVHRHDGIAHVYQAKGKIFYDNYNPKTERLVDLSEEPYEEAVSLVQGPSSEELLNQIRSIEAIVQTFAEQMQQEFGLTYTTETGITARNINPLQLMLISHQRVTLAEAREIEVKATERLLSLISPHMTMSIPEISICFKHEGSPNAGNILYVFQSNGKVFYQSYDPGARDLLRNDAESYQEALRITSKR
ncbi:MAG TPA: hypothetical protein PKW79_01145 [Rhabdochlamydiaceae bacterium]|nr:hypothetical protein [Rhabdochlamydiaceae bacterium]